MLDITTDAKFLFLVIEGLDGSGKTTIAEILYKRFKSDGFSVLLTNEPNRNYCSGDFIDSILKKKIKGVSNKTLALAFSANRMDHIERQILPFIKQNNRSIVICDRYYLSAMAYQVGGEIDHDYIRLLNRFSIKPNHTIFLDTSPKICESRIADRFSQKELFEQNFKEMRNNFLVSIEYLCKQGESVDIIDASNSVPQVANIVINSIKCACPKWELKIS